MSTTQPREQCYGYSHHNSLSKCPPASRPIPTISHDHLCHSSQARSSPEWREHSLIDAVERLRDSRELPGTKTHWQSAGGHGFVIPRQLGHSLHKSPRGVLNEEHFLYASVEISTGRTTSELGQDVVRRSGERELPEGERSP